MLSADVWPSLHRDVGTCHTTMGQNPSRQELAAWLESVTALPRQAATQRLPDRCYHAFRYCLGRETRSLALYVGSRCFPEKRCLTRMALPNLSSTCQRFYASAKRRWEGGISTSAGPRCAREREWRCLVWRAVMGAQFQRLAVRAAMRASNGETSASGPPCERKKRQGRRVRPRRWRLLPIPPAPPGVVWSEVCDSWVDA